MKKILLIYPEMNVGGSTVSLLSFLQGIDKREFEIFLQLAENTGDLFYMIPSNIKILPGANRYHGIIGKFLKALLFIVTGYFFKAIYLSIKNHKLGLSNEVLREFRLKKLNRAPKEKYDYAISYLEGWSNHYLAYNVIADKKYAWIHSTFSKTYDYAVNNTAWINNVDNIVFVTDACKNEFDALYPQYAQKSIIVANVIDSSVIRERAQNIENDEFYNNFVKNNTINIITVCRLTINTKGLDRIVNAVKKLKASGFEFLWYIIGDGPDKLALNKLIEEAEVTDYIKVVGQKLNPYSFIKAADLMCLPSRYEGKPMVITESMILGVPAVVTKYLSANEQIENGTDGFVVENNDEALYYALKEILGNEKIIAELKLNLSKKEYGNADYIKYIEKLLFY